MSAPDINEVVTIGGEEYMRYKPIPLDYCIIRGTYVDEYGNLTTDEEAMQLALDFYGPMYLLYSVYDAAEEKETVAPMLAAHIRRFISRIETGYRWNGETDFEGGERLL